MHLKTNADLKFALREFNQHQEWYKQERCKQFVDKEWKKEWLSIYPYPRIYFLKIYLGNIDKLKTELAKKTGKALHSTLGLKPEKLSPKKYLEVLNLLIERIHRQDRKVLKDRIRKAKEKERKLKKRFPTKDIRDNRLFPLVCYSYELSEDHADKLKGFIIRREMAFSYAKRYFKEHRKELEQEYKDKFNKDIAKSKYKRQWKKYEINEMRGKILNNEIIIPKDKLRLPKDGRLNSRLYVRESVPEKDKISLNSELETLREMTIPTLKMAMEKINKQRKIFPEKYFELNKKKIYDRLKHYNKKYKSRKKII